MAANHNRAHTDNPEPPNDPQLDPIPSRIAAYTQGLYPVTGAKIDLFGGSSEDEVTPPITNSSQETIEFIKQYLAYKYEDRWTVGQLKTICEQFRVREHYLAIFDALFE